MTIPHGSLSSPNKGIITYLHGTPQSEQYSKAAMALFWRYIEAFQNPTQLQQLLSGNFVHADDGIRCIGNTFALTPFGVVHGADKFIQAFREGTVDRQIEQDPQGRRGTYLPPSTAERLLALARAQLKRQGKAVEDNLLAAAILYIPGRLRIGGDPLARPDFLADAGDEYEPLSAYPKPEDPRQNEHVIRVVQFVLEKNGSITARIGIKLAGYIDLGGIRYHMGNMVTVPGGIVEETLFNRGQRDEAEDPFNPPTHDDMARWLVNALAA